MSRPTVWYTVLRNFLDSLSRNKAPLKQVVGEDRAGNKFYELKRRTGVSHNVNRGYEPGTAEPAPEWAAWLQGTRRFPPSDEEIRLNKARNEQVQQAQWAQDAATERRAPQVGSRGKGAADLDRKHNFPAYDDAELAPGAERRDDRSRR